VKKIKLVMLLGLLAGLPGCTQQQAQTAANIVVTVTADLCALAPLVTSNPPGFVTLLCKLDGALAGQTATVVVPAAQWTEIQAAATAAKANGAR